MNKNGVKLLAAALVMVMAFAAVAVVVETSESDAASSDITYLGGTITGSGYQVFGPGSNVIVEKDLVIPADKTLIIGGKFTVNEGAELTIKGKLIILPGASATFNADVTVEDKGEINNAAYYDGTNKVNGSYIGFFLNAELNVAKGGIVKGVNPTDIKNTVPSARDITGIDSAGYGPWGHGDVTVVEDASTASGNYLGTFYLSSSNAYIYGINGVGNYGYWIGLYLTIDNAKSGSAAKITYDGRTSDSSDSLVNKQLQLWVSAGTVNNITVQYTDSDETKKTISFTVDTTNCVGSSAVSGEIIVNNGGSFVMNSSKTNPSWITGQTILLKEGATADLNGKVSVVTVSAAGTGIYSYGSVTIPENSNTDVLTLSFGSISEKIGTAYVNDNEYTKAVNNILLVSGTIENRYTLEINETAARAGIVPPTAKVLYYADENGKKTGVPITGTVRIAEGTSLKVLASGAMDVKANAILEVDGTLSATGKKDAGVTTAATDRSTAKLSGKVYVSGTVNIDQIVNNNKGAVALEIANTAYLVIVDDGTISIKEYEINTTTWANCPVATLGATFVDDDKVFHVMSLPAAIAYAEKNDVKDIDVWSIPKSQQDANKILAMDCVIDADLTIPDDISIMIDAVIVISKGATLTISEDAEYASYATARGGLIVVEGDFIDYTMTLLNYGISQTTSLPAVDAEVMFIDSAETYYRYTTLADALNGAAEGSTIELFGNVDVKNNLTIGKGITVLANGMTLTVENDSELIVEGILDLINKRNGSTADGKVKLIAKTDYKAAGKLTVNNIVVIGGISSVNEFTVSTSTPADKYIAGFYAYGTIGDLTDENFILAPAVAATNSKTLEDLKVYTKTTYSGDLVFDGGDEAQTITVDKGATYTGNFKVGKITLKNYNLVIDEEALFNGTVAGANGAIEAVNIMGANGKSVTFSDVVDTDKGTDILSIAGTPEKVDSEGKKTAVNDKNTATMSVIDGTIVSEIFTASSLKSFNINEGTVLEISSNSESVTFTASEMTVDGTVNVMKNGTLNVTTLTINGTVYVKVATADDSSYGSITATTIYVGINSKAMTTTGAAATLSADAVNNLEIIYVADGAIVSEKILKGVNSTEFYVEDALWMTVYQKTGSIKVTSIAKAPVTNADFKGWETADGKEITTTNNYDIGATGAEKVYAIIDYNVYNVKIVGDNGIGTVSIDGVVLMKVSNTFVLADKITAGTHTIIVELKNGYTGTVVMTMDGKTLSDGKFTLSGDKTADRNKTIILSGTEPIVEPDTPVEPEKKDDGMGITEYLLIVLVVLAAILVVIVAIRMMRS